MIQNCFTFTSNKILRRLTGKMWMSEFCEVTMVIYLYSFIGNTNHILHLTAYNSYIIQTSVVFFSQVFRVFNVSMACLNLLENQNFMNVVSTHSQHVNMIDIKQSCYVCVHFLNKHWRLFLESWNECPETLCMSMSVRFETWYRSSRPEHRLAKSVPLGKSSSNSSGLNSCKKHFSRSKKLNVSYGQLWIVMSSRQLGSSQGFGAREMLVI